MPSSGNLIGMKMRMLGETGLTVSVACLGTMTFGWEPDDWGSTEEQAREIFDRALELGINFFDTADMYARGLSEEILGRFIAGRRDDLVIATKCHFPMSDTNPNLRGNSRKNIIAACEASLKRLGTDYIDLYQLHRPHPEVRIDETLRALDDLVRSGKVRYIGTSTFAAWQLCEAHYVAKALGTNGFQCEQPPYNLLDRRIERELLPFLRTYGFGCIPWSPLAGGQLSGKYLEGQAENARYSKSDPSGRTKGNIERIAGLKKIADEHGLTLTQMSLAWVAQQPGITAPILGARSVAQLEQSVAAVNFELSQEVLDAIDEVAPPGTNTGSYYDANFGPNRRPWV